MATATEAKRQRLQDTRLAAAKACLGPLTPGMARFCVTWGEFSYVDAILHCLDGVGPAHLSLWTWVAAAYDIQQLCAHPHAVTGTLLIDMDARTRTRNNTAFAVQWRARFGPDSLRYVVSHAKMALLESASYRVLLRGSANLNRNDRLEQLDITEGGADFDLVKRIVDDYPLLPDEVTAKEVYVVCKVGGRVDAREVAGLRGLKVWAR